MLASILHRMSGAALYGGLLLVVVWLACLAAGPEAYGVFAAVSGSVFGLIVWFLLTLALTYHLMSGIRHLLWDTGRGLEPRTASLLSTASIIAGLVLAVAFFALLLTGGRIGS